MANKINTRPIIIDTLSGSDYKTGTLTAINGTGTGTATVVAYSNTITGASTTWNTSSYLIVGDEIRFDGDPIWYKVAVVTSDSSIAVDPVPKAALAAVGYTRRKKTLTGSGTAWKTGSPNSVIVNDKIKITGSDRWYTVSSITDDTHVVLTEPYAGAGGAGLTYTVKGAQITRNITVKEIQWNGVSTNAHVL